MIDKKRLRDIFKAVAVPVLTAAVVIGGPVTYNTVTRQDMQVTITNTESRLMNKNEGFGFTKTVYQTEKGELTNVLSPLNLKFNRSAIRDTLKKGETYDVTTVGISIPALRIYPNIIKASPVKPQGR
jgi:phosphoribosyl-dephospho-CoA transferase